MGTSHAGNSPSPTRRALRHDEQHKRVTAREADGWRQTGPGSLFYEGDGCHKNPKLRDSEQGGVVCRGRERDSERAGCAGLIYAKGEARHGGPTARAVVQQRAKGRDCGVRAPVRVRSPVNPGHVCPSAGISIRRHGETACRIAAIAARVGGLIRAHVARSRGT